MALCDRLRSSEVLVVSEDWSDGSTENEKTSIAELNSFLQKNEIWLMTVWYLDTILYEHGTQG